MRWRSVLVALAVCLFLTSSASIFEASTGEALPQGIVPAPMNCFINLAHRPPHFSLHLQTCATLPPLPDRPPVVSDSSIPDGA